MKDAVNSVSSGVPVEALSKLSLKPALFDPGDTQLWVNPYVSTQMLKAHLDPTRDAASRRPEAIDAEAAWIVSRLGLTPGDRVLDLGCGPGLYCTRLASMGLDVTGVDQSQGSIGYARKAAEAQRLSITYRVQDYLTLDDRDAFQAVLLIYGDFGALADADRDALLDRIHRALRPGGHFVFDVMTPTALAMVQPGRCWEAREGGFWRPMPHLVLESRFTYPDDSVSLHQYGILDERGQLEVYRVWSRYYSGESLVPLLEGHSFRVDGMTSDLAGKPYASDSRWLGVVAQKK